MKPQINWPLAFLIVVLIVAVIFLVLLVAYGLSNPQVIVMTATLEPEQGSRPADQVAATATELVDRLGTVWDMVGTETARRTATAEAP